jgi:putative PEP-CTERM system histidine kinase
VDLASLGYGLAALLHAALAVTLLVDAVHRRAADPASVFFVGAVAVTGAWGAAAMLAQPGGQDLARLAAMLLDLGRYGLWFACLIVLIVPALPGSSGRTRLLASVASGLIVATLGLLVWLGVATPSEDSLLRRCFFALLLAQPVFGLVLVEQLYRGGAESRWGNKPFCVALGMVFMFDIYLYSEAALFGGLDGASYSIRGAVHACSVPLLLIAHRRQHALMHMLRLSRDAAFQTATLVFVGAYLLFISAAGYYVREVGGQWGNALQLGLMFIGGTGLVVILMSGSVRARLRVFVGKHFFRYRYDYRSEWLRFTSRLSAAVAPHEVGVLVVRGLADMVESPAGALWSRRADSGEFVQSARWNMPHTTARESIHSPLATLLRIENWIVDIDECRADPARYHGLALPAWLVDAPAAWLVVPLPVADDLIGFVVLAQPRTPLQINWEVRDLLKTASRQAAGFLAQMQATEALLEARKFEAFNRMSAFVVHDLKNIVTQLSLLMKNAKRLHANPEFQQDMLATVENSLDKMRQLILQLREGQAPAAASSGVALAPILMRLGKVAGDRGRAVELQVIDQVSTRGHEDRIERVLGHMLQNAIEATSAEDCVWLRLQRSSGHAQVVVGDTGRGMAPEFVHTRLFKPFNTTKQGGMGIGAYESYQYVKELGGSIEVDTEENRGTIVTIKLPLFDGQETFDLHMAGAK